MIKILTTIVLLIELSSTLALAQTTTRTYQDNMGRETGRSVTDRNGNTTIYDNMGRETGRITTDRNGNTTSYDRMGRETGRSRGK
jgi:hypothetical protein